MILSAHISGIADNPVSFSGIVISLNSSESSKIYLSASASTLCIALFELGNLFYAKYNYISLKYGLFIQLVSLLWLQADVYLLIPFFFMIFNILPMSVYFGKYFCTRLLVLIKSANSGGSSN